MWVARKNVTVVGGTSTTNVTTTENVIIPD